jgi:hypothetical protein
MRSRTVAPPPKTIAPARYDSATIRPFCSSVQRRRRPTPVRISTRPRGRELSNISSTIYVNRSRQTDPHLTNCQRRRKVRSKHRYHSFDADCISRSPSLPRKTRSDEGGYWIVNVNADNRGLSRAIAYRNGRSNAFGHQRRQEIFWTPLTPNRLAASPSKTCNLKRAHNVLAKCCPPKARVKSARAESEEERVL